MKKVIQRFVLLTVIFAQNTFAQSVYVSPVISERQFMAWEKDKVIAKHTLHQDFFNGKRNLREYPVNIFVRNAKDQDKYLTSVISNIYSSGQGYEIVSSAISNTKGCEMLKVFDHSNQCERKAQKLKFNFFKSGIANGMLEIGSGLQIKKWNSLGIVGQNRLSAKIISVSVGVCKVNFNTIPFINQANNYKQKLKLVEDKLFLNYGIPHGSGSTNLQIIGGLPSELQDLLKERKIYVDFFKLTGCMV